ncbi:MAG: site-2 protease family protein [Dehalococcoidia bacterium]
MGRSIQLGKLFGIPFKLHYSWFLIFIFITVILSYAYYPEVTDDSWSTAAYWVLGVLTSLLFFASVVIHELSHSAVAIRAGMPVKSITLFFFGGVAQITREATKPTIELKMAIAGPLASITLAGLYYGIFWISSGFNEYLAVVCWWLALINGVLAVFNMIPGFPLDGGRVFRSIVWLVTGNYMRATRIATMAGRGVAYLFILGGIVLLFLPQWLFNGLWFLFLGFLLYSAATTSYRQAVLLDALRGFTAQDVMTRDPPLVPRNLTIRELIQRRFLPTSSQFFLVVEGESVGGLLTLRRIKGIPKEEWDIITTGQAMTPVEKLKTVRPSDDALGVLQRMDEENLNEIAVAGGGKVIGVVVRENLIRFAQSLQGLRR